ncbi:MAG: hypothetical protein ACNYPE_09610 [Candidatus Azotimanducaceae bacterium WSBS_2022_MAG_OTU7]
MNEKVLKSQLKKIVDDINAGNSSSRVEFKQQRKTTANMSVTGGNGRIYIQPSSIGYDVSLSGQSLERQMCSYMINLFGKNCDGYKQRNATQGFKRQPFWRTDDLSKVRKAIFHYASSGE